MICRGEVRCEKGYILVELLAKNETLKISLANAIHSLTYVIVNNDIKYIPLMIFLLMDYCYQLY
jgi:hypothetical protein